MTKDEMEIAALAALVGNSLKNVDNSMSGRSANGPANKINLNNFISGNKQPQQQQSSATRQIKGLEFITPPKSYSVGQEAAPNVNDFNPNLMLQPPPDLLNNIAELERIEKEKLHNGQLRPVIPGIEPPLISNNLIMGHAEVSNQNYGAINISPIELDKLLNNAKIIIEKMDTIIQLLQPKPKKKKSKYVE